LFLFLAIFSGCSIQGNDKKDKYSELDNKHINQEESGAPLDFGYSISLTSPQEGQILKSPFLVGGVANVPSDVVYVRVRKPDGEIVISEQAKAKKIGDEKEGAFGVLIRFMFQSTDHGVVEVYGINESTGEEVALKSVEVSFDVNTSGRMENIAQ